MAHCVRSDTKMYPYEKGLIPFARALRRNMTPEEKHLWYDCLCHLPMRVKRQKNIANYIVDFYIPQSKLAIEVDGLQHTDAEHRENDAKRDAILASLGIGVLRFSNESIRHNFKGVCEEILTRLGIEEG